MKEFMAMRTVIKVCVSLAATGFFFLSVNAGAADGHPKAKDKKMYESVKTCQKECKSTRKNMSNEAYEDCMSKCWNDNQKDQVVPATKK
jgi:hypothetical protein